MQFKHKQYSEIKQLIAAGIPTHLTGPSGSGKSTLAIQIASELKQQLSVMPCTRQTSVGNLLGFMSVNNEYVSTPLRDAVEHGHIFLLEELTAVDANVILCLNSLDNGFIQFPDKLVHTHPDFKLVATSNPVTAQYGARTELDFSTANRYATISVPYDKTLATNITSPEVQSLTELLQTFFDERGITDEITMRSQKFLQQFIDLNIYDNPVAKLIDSKDDETKQALTEFMTQHKAKLDAAKLENERVAKLKQKKQSNCKAISELKELVAIHSS